MMFLFTDSTIEDYLDRETRKAMAYSRFESTDAYSSLPLFEVVSEAWWDRQYGKKPKLSEYRRHLTRAQLLAGYAVTSEILEVYPPATGPLHILPGGSDWHRNKLKSSS